MYFIVFEWMDWTGKDTQLNNTFKYLLDQNKFLQIRRTREPTPYTKAWKIIYEKLNWGWFSSALEAAKLYVEDRIEQSVFRRDIIKHSIILSSRFDYSTYAYQSVQGMSFDEIYDLHNYTNNNILQPDISFIFDVSMENWEKRVLWRWEKIWYFEKIDFMKKTKQKYLEVYDFFKNKRKVYLIDANRSIEQVFEQIKNVLDTQVLANIKIE